ncbi:hypothetical protein B9G69_005820 [Bdellovibrio sp. SKB1291214]|uniref:hypothetical protein n=1 Tax=Bdellovibrio sp. SKB1291214 TaxID=1732569 RepID=UPI0011320435|nr:hypothetical protein [Bdellovibrio sp. SKB1291214]UYL10094.1 hypothetical protein B9G69_005820 [Bdellovibrio sp. SKB1291214]
MAEIFVRSAAPLAAVSLVLWLITIYREQRNEIVEHFNRNIWGLLLSVALASVIFLILRVGYRVLSDETNLLGVSRDIATHFQSYNFMQGIYFPDDHYMVIENEIPTRPVMFPLMAALLHLFFGISANNFFILNFFLFVALLFTFYCLLKNKGPWVQVAGTILLAMNASLAWHVASAGFDLCSLLFAFWTFLFLWKYLSEPCSKNFKLLAFTSLMFIQIRYESVMYMPIIMTAMICLHGRETWQRVRQSPWLLLFPLLLTPLVLQRFLTWGRFENAPELPPFTYKNIPNHGAIFLEFFFNHKDSIYPLITNALGLAGAILLFRIYRDRKTRLFIHTCTVASLALLILMLCHHMGRANVYTQYRLFMPLTVVLLAAFCFSLSENKKVLWALSPLLVMQVFMGYRFLNEHRDFEDLPREMKIIEEFLARDPQNNSLFIYHRPGQITSSGHSSVISKYFSYHNDLFRVWRNFGSIGKIYEINQTWHFGDVELPIYPGWRRIPIETYPQSPFSHLQIDELIPEVKGLQDQ